MDEVRLLRLLGRQIFRLPRGYRVEGDRVRVRKVGDCVVLEPAARDREKIAAWLEDIRMADFMAAGREQPLPQERDWPSAS